MSTCHMSLEVELLKRKGNTKGKHGEWAKINTDRNTVKLMTVCTLNSKLRNKKVRFVI